MDRGHGGRMALPGSSGRMASSFKLVCPLGDYVMYVAFYSRQHRPRCPAHNLALKLDESWEGEEETQLSEKKEQEEKKEQR
jgi:hypothetical protein